MCNCGSAVELIKHYFLQCSNFKNARQSHLRFHQYCSATIWTTFSIKFEFEYKMQNTAFWKVLMVGACPISRSINNQFNNLIRLSRDEICRKCQFQEPWTQLIRKMCFHRQICRKYSSMDFSLMTKVRDFKNWLQLLRNYRRKFCHRACLTNGQNLTQKIFVQYPFKNWCFWFPYILKF